MSTLNISNGNISNVTTASSLSVNGFAISNSFTVGAVTVNTSQITVGNSIVNSSVIKTDSLVLSGTTLTAPVLGAIVNTQIFTANGTWVDPSYTFSPSSTYTQGLVYTYYIHALSHPGTQSAMDTFFSNATATYQSSYVHTGTINWSDSAVTGAGGVTGSKPTYLRADNYSWQVEGFILAPETGTYTFAIDSDDCSDVFVNGVNVVNIYTTSGRGFTGSWTTGTISLTANTYYTFKARMEEGGGADGIQVGWRKPSDGSTAIIPANAFYQTSYVNNGYTGNEQVLVMAWGGGGGGNTTTTVTGGGGGSCIINYYTLSQLLGGVSVTVGGGGALNTSGSNSVFSSLTAYGGGAGRTTTAGGGGGFTNVGTSGGAGGDPLGGSAGNPGGTSTLGGGGPGNAGGAAGGTSVFGGGGGGTTTGAGGLSIFGGGGGSGSTGVTGNTVFGGIGANSSTAASVPGGGGSGTTNTTGARGEVRVWIIK